MFYRDIAIAKMNHSVLSVGHGSKISACKLTRFSFKSLSSLLLRIKSQLKLSVQLYSRLSQWNKFNCLPSKPNLKRLLTSSLCCIQKHCSLLKKISNPLFWLHIIKNFVTTLALLKTFAPHAPTFLAYLVCISACLHINLKYVQNILLSKKWNCKCSCSRATTCT